MRKGKKNNMKSDPQEQSSDGPDSGEDQLQNKKGKVSRTTKMPRIEGSDDIPKSSAKKGKAKGTKKKPTRNPTTEEQDAGTSEKPKQSSKGAKKQIKKIEESVKESPNSSDKKNSEKPKKSQKQMRKVIKLPVRDAPVRGAPVRSAPDNADAEAEPPQTNVRAKVRGRKVKKPLQPPPDNSDTDEEVPRNTRQKVKNFRGRQKKNEDSDNDSSDNTDEVPRNTRQNVKYIRGRQIKNEDSDNDSSHSSDSDVEVPRNTRQNVKNVRGLKKKQRHTHSSDSDKQPSRTTKATKVKNARASDSVEESSDEADDEEESSPMKKVVQRNNKIIPVNVVMPMQCQELSNRSVNVNDLLVEAPNYTPPEYHGQSSSDDSDESSDTELISSTRRYRDTLETVDPDFYKFLQEHDAQLLDFDEHEHILDEKEDDELSESIHVPKQELDVGSDESDFEDEDAASIKGNVTLHMVHQMSLDMANQDVKTKLSTIVNATKLFNAAVNRATSEDGNTEGEFKVRGSSVFNNIINMCVMYLPAGIEKYLGMQTNTNPIKCKHFVKIKGILVEYLNDLLKLLPAITSVNILIVTLKHLHQMAKFVACFTRIAKKAIKMLLPLWSSGEETVRVLAFVSILRITRNQMTVLYEPVLKAMFLTYVKNAKFVSPTTWPGINFLRRSLTEMFMLDLTVAYPLVFLYIRQLGIHLRNAILVSKTENAQSVYNWQFVNSLRLWAQILQQSMHHPGMQALYFPLSMIISHTIKLKPTSQYYPLRFHLTEILIEMSRESGKFVPVLGFLLDVLRKFDFNKRHYNVSMRPLDFSCLLRLNKSQMTGNSYKDATVDKLYGLLLEYVTDISHQLAFPDVTMIVCLYLRLQMEKCKVPNYRRKLKQLHDKIEDNAKYIKNIRSKHGLYLNNYKLTQAWQRRIKAKGTPLRIFFDNWSKLNKIQKRKIATNNDQLAGEMPIIKRTKVIHEAEDLFKNNPLEPMTLFPSDDEDEKDFFGAPCLKVEPLKVINIQRDEEKPKVEVEIPDETADTIDEDDIIMDIKVDDW